MKLNRNLSVSLALAAGVVAMGTTASMAADSVADFYKGKRVQILIGSGAGGGYDTYARTVARHIGRYIPGKPSILAKNMDGAGSIVVTNYISNVAPKDGSIIGALQREIALVQLLGQKGPKYKAQELNWLGSLSAEPGVCAIRTATGIKNFGEVFERQFLIGGTGPNITEFHPAMLNNLLGAKIKLIKGYPSTPPVHLGIQRGEVDGICQSWSSFKEQAGKFLRDGNIKPLVQMHLKPSEEMTKLGIPMIWDYVTEKHAQPGYSVEDIKNYFNIVMSTGFMGRPYALSAGVPAERVKALRAAFGAMVKDAKFLADAKRQRRDVSFVSGEEIQEIVAKAAGTPADKLAKVNDLMKFKGVTAKAVLKLVSFSGKVTGTKRGGRSMAFKGKEGKLKIKVSGSKTKVTINGEKAKRSAVKKGMACTVSSYGSGTTATKIDCKG
jgi:tripartite-type tricarboxylate transporter receptor subunit TctC